MAVPTKREAQAMQRRNQLLDVARRLFAEKGMERASIKDIAEVAGVAQGLIYHYFRSKDELFWAIIERDGPLPLVGTIFSGSETLPARDYLVPAMTRAHAAMSERRDLLRLVIHEALGRTELQERIRGLQHLMIGLIASYLDRRVAAGELRPHDTRMTALMLAGSVFALLFVGLPAEPYIAETVETVLRGLSASG
ncbi:MAG: TetR/AcrR family transcriptional regulator [Ktedonobacterales bacterium]